MTELYGAPYPITKYSRGLLHTQKGIDVIKSDLLALLLTVPGERVMLPDFGTPLNELMFEPSDSEIIDLAREMILNSISTWEPRVVVESLEIDTTTNPDVIEDSLNPLDTKDEIGSILLVSIRFSDFENISDINELKLQIPLGG